VTAATIASATRLYSGAGSRIGRYHRSARAHAFRLGQHRRKLHSDIRRQIDLVDDQQIAPQQPRALLRGISSPPATSITNIHQSHQVERKGRSEIVATGFEQNQFDTGNLASRS